MVGASRERIKEALKCLNIVVKVMARKSNEMWDIGRGGKCSGGKNLNRQIGEASN